MYALFVVCLVGGLVATALLAALGGLAGHLHAAPTHSQLPSSAHGHLQLPGSHAHAGAPGAQPQTLSHPVAHGQVAAGAHAMPTHASDAQHAVAPSTQPGWSAMALGWTLSWLSPLTLAAAALGFGGAGLILYSFSHLLALPGAVVGAVVGATVVRALIGAFMRADTPALQAGAEGAIGQINAPIRADCMGEVLYTLEGLQRSAPARTVDGTPLPRGTRVVIVRREHGIAWVESLDPLPPVPDAMPPPAELPHAGSAAGVDLQHVSHGE